MGVVGFTCCTVLGGLFLLLGFGVRVFPGFSGGGLVGWTWASLVFGLSLLLGCGAGTSCGCWLSLVCGYLFWVVAHVSDLLVWGLGLLFLIGGLREFRLVLVYLDLLGFWML